MSTVENARTDPTNALDSFAFPEPVTHGVGVTFHYKDIGLYDQARDIAHDNREKVSDGNNSPQVQSFDVAGVSQNAPDTSPMPSNASTKSQA